MILKKIQQFFIVLIIAPVGVYAQETNNELSLKDAVSYAMSGNNDIKKQNLAEQQSRQKVLEVKGQGLPQINASAQLTDNLKLPTQLLPGEIVGQPGTQIAVEFGVQYMIPLTVQASQLLYSQAFLVGIRQAKAAEELTKVQGQKVQQDVIYNIAAAYYQAAILREQTVLIQANIEKIKQSLQVVQSQFDNQMARKIDLDQLNVAYSNTKTELVNAQLQYSYALDMIKILIGYPLSDTLLLSETVSGQSDVVLENTTGNNATLSLIQNQQTLKELEMKGIRAKYLPTVSAFAQYTYMTQFDEWTSSQMKWNSSSAIGVQVNVPIFDGRQKHRQVVQRKFELQSIQLDRELTEKHLNLQYSNAVNKYLQNEKTVNNQEANLTLAQNVYDAIQANYKNGLASLSDLINADTGLKSAQFSYLSAMLQKNISMLDILRANGSIADIMN